MQTHLQVRIWLVLFASPITPFSLPQYLSTTRKEIFLKSLKSQQNEELKDTNTKMDI